MAQGLNISTINEFGDFQVVLDGQKISDVASYTLQEGYFGANRDVYTRTLTLKILLGPKREVEVRRQLRRKQPRLRSL